jgi:hypothetical protein
MEITSGEEVFRGTDCVCSEATPDGNAELRAGLVKLAQQKPQNL